MDKCDFRALGAVCRPLFHQDFLRVSQIWGFTAVVVGFLMDMVHFLTPDPPQNRPKTPLFRGGWGGPPQTPFFSLFFTFFRKKPKKHEKWVLGGY